MVARRNYLLRFVILSLTVSMLLSGCVPASPALTPVPQPTATPQVIIQGENPSKEEIQTIEIDNCNGKTDIPRTETRSQSIETTISAELAAKLGAQGPVIYGEVQATVGAALGRKAERTSSIQVSASPGSRMYFQLAWTGPEQIGFVQNLRGSNLPIVFTVFTPTDVKIKNQLDLGCPTSTVPKPVSIPNPPQVTERVIPTQKPNIAQPVAVSVAQSIRLHTATSIGTGVFAQATFSDGLAPYDENWLWANNHFNIQRIRRDEQPDGCGISEHEVDRIWIGAGAVMKVTVNGVEVGTITTATGRHGYVVMLPLHTNDRICVSPIPVSGFHIVFGPDVYYHHDSYCYRDNC